MPFVVEYHDEKKHGFNERTQDDEWLAVAGQNKWVVLSHDKKFHSDSMALLAVQQHKVACFYFDGGTYKTWDKVVLLARCYLKIRDIVKTAKRPFIYHVRHTGRVTLFRGW